MTFFEQFLADSQARCEKHLATHLPSADTLPDRLHAAMRYACLNGGKRLRPALVYAVEKLFNLSPFVMDQIAGSIEIIHCYSLVHDDLPAMDDDDLRRGLPTCHKAFDEATAILVGDALQPLAFEWLTKLSVDAEIKIHLIRTLAEASGSIGMVGGQALDLEATARPTSIEYLTNLHNRKTGALIQAAIAMPLALVENLSRKQESALLDYAQCLGLAFQIQDDILDIESSTETLGKRQGADVAQQKTTYPRLLGLEGARSKAESLSQRALIAVHDFGEKAELLTELARFTVNRLK